MTTSEIIEAVSNNEEAMFLPEEYHPALVGVGWRFSDGPLPVYNIEVVLEILTQDGTSMEDAMEWYQYNIIGSWIGSGTPIFVDL
jgi:hypothetical protein